jgi:hypothetical protein
MTELWIPNLNDTPDVTNVYDMMVLFQEQLDEVRTPDDIHSWRALAEGALRSLSRAIKEMPFEERQISVATNLALVKSVEEQDKMLEVANVGLRGSLYDVDCIKRGAGFQPELSLAMDVESFFPITDPSDGDFIFTTASTPIGKVQYIRPDITDADAISSI